jgi:hypothetical protein
MVRHRVESNWIARPMVLASSMPESRYRIELDADELAAYPAAVIACARRGERRTAERLLGQVASLEARAQPVRRLEFVPAAASAALASRALDHLRRDARH